MEQSYDYLMKNLDAEIMVLYNTFGIMVTFYSAIIIRKGGGRQRQVKWSPGQQRKTDETELMCIRQFSLPVLKPV